MVPRVKCPEHGVKQIAVPWAEPGSRFTALYECLVIDWLKEASIAAVSRHLSLSWDEVDACLDAGDPSLLVFEQDEVLRRVERDGDLFAPVLTLVQELPRF